MGEKQRGDDQPVEMTNRQVQMKAASPWKMSAQQLCRTGLTCMRGLDVRVIALSSMVSIKTWRIAQGALQAEGPFDAPHEITW